MAGLRADGIKCIVVTSGAVATGMKQLGFVDRPNELPRIQALAAVGQGVLMASYQEVFAAHGLACAQVLLTHEALSSRPHFINIRHTLSEALSMGVVPIANENDTVAVEELRFGDNDRLAAALATAADADLVVLMSDVDALYDADPRREPTAQPVVLIRGLEELRRARASVDAVTGSAVGTGGMLSKLDAAELAMSAGIALVVCSGDDLASLESVARGQEYGTLFTADKRQPRRRHWIAWLSKVKGHLTIDEGAVVALTTKGSSLLAAGVTAIEGTFNRGESVSVHDPSGREVARGLVGYDAADASRILGLRKSEIRRELNLSAVDPMIHRDDLHLS